MSKCTEEAWVLTQEFLKDDNQRSLVTTVTYSSLLKGFAKQSDKVVELYNEMQVSGVECNTITYNTILNAFAQCGAMHRAPKLLEDMQALGSAAAPDLVTYSTLIKGYCGAGDINQAFAILNDMKKVGKFTPDEVMYNSLLDGCAKGQRIQEALQLIDDMRASGVKPSNFTLSMLVKLLGRCKRLTQAFSIVESITTEYRFRPNIQVYTCLIQACFQNRQPARAITLLDTILKDGLRPDEMTYTALARGCLQASLAEEAAEMTRRAFQDHNPPAGVDSRILGEVVAMLGTNSEAGKTLMADVAACRQVAASRQVGRGQDEQARRPNLGDRPTSSPSEKAPWRLNKSAASPPWRSGVHREDREGVANIAALLRG